MRRHIEVGVKNLDMYMTRTLRLLLKVLKGNYWVIGALLIITYIIVIIINPK
jgi:hypothetical protein